MLKLFALLFCVCVSLSYNSASVIQDEHNKLVGLVFKLAGTNDDKKMPLQERKTPSNENMIICASEPKSSDKCKQNPAKIDLLQSIQVSTDSVLDMIKQVFNLHDASRPVARGPVAPTILSCKSESEQLRIIMAIMSNKNEKNCPTEPSKEEPKKKCSEFVETTKTLKALCDGKNRCQFSIDKELETMCQCAENKYLDLTFACANPEDYDEKSIEDEDAKVRRSKRALHYIFAPPLEGRETSGPNAETHRRTTEYGPRYGQPIEFEAEHEARRRRVEAEAEARRPVEARRIAADSEVRREEAEVRRRRPAADAEVAEARRARSEVGRRRGEADVSEEGRRQAEVREGGRRQAEVREGGRRQAEIREGGRIQAEVREGGRRQAEVREGGRRQAEVREGGRRQAEVREGGRRQAEVREGGRRRGGQHEVLEGRGGYGGFGGYGGLGFDYYDPFYGLAYDYYSGIFNRLGGWGGWGPLYSILAENRPHEIREVKEVKEVKEVRRPQEVREVKETSRGRSETQKTRNAHENRRLEN